MAFDRRKSAGRKSTGRRSSGASAASFMSCQSGGSFPSPGQAKTPQRTPPKRRLSSAKRSLGGTTIRKPPARPSAGGRKSVGVSRSIVKPRARLSEAKAGLSETPKRRLSTGGKARPGSDVSMAPSNDTARKRRLSTGGKADQRGGSPRVESAAKRARGMEVESAAKRARGGPSPGPRRGGPSPRQPRRSTRGRVGATRKLTPDQQTQASLPPPPAAKRSFQRLTPTQHILPPAKRRRVAPASEPKKRLSPKNKPSPRARSPKASPKPSPKIVSPLRRTSPRAASPKATPKGDGLDSLTVKQLKALLVERGLKHADCVEKQDLVDRLRSKRRGSPSPPPTGPPKVADRFPKPTPRPAATPFTFARATPGQTPFGMGTPATPATPFGATPSQKKPDTKAEIQRIQRCRHGPGVRLFGPGPARGQKKSLFDAWSVLGLPQHSSIAEAKKRHKQLIVMLHPDKTQALGPSLAKQATEALHDVHEALQAITEGQKASAPPPMPGRIRAERTNPTEAVWTFVLHWEPSDSTEKRPVDGYKVYIRDPGAFPGDQRAFIDQGEASRSASDSGKVEYAISLTRPQNMPLRSRRSFEVLVAAFNSAGTSQTTSTQVYVR